MSCQKVRNPAFDVGKFILMLCVVAGHLAGNGFVAIDVNDASWVYNMRMGVAMPFFFCVSGYFAVKTIEDADWCKIVARMIGFLWPLFSFGIVFGCILYLTGGQSLFATVTYPLGRVVGGSWFLRAMAIVWILSAFVMKFCKTKLLRCIISVVIYGGLVFVSQEGFCLGSVMHMYPYFVFGMLFLRPCEFHRVNSISMGCGIIFLAITFFEGNCRTNGMSFYWVSADWRDMLLSVRGFVCFVGRTIVGITGSVFLLWVIDRVGVVIPKIFWLGQFGTTTLGVYVMHEWPLVQFHKIGLFQGFPACMQWPLAVILFFFFHYLTLGVRTVPCLKFIFFGDEKWLTEKLQGSKLFDKLFA